MQIEWSSDTDTNERTNLFMRVCANGTMCCANSSRAFTLSIHTYSVCWYYFYGCEIQVLIIKISRRIRMRQCIPKHSMCAHSPHSPLSSFQFFSVGFARARFHSTRWRKWVRTNSTNWYICGLRTKNPTANTQHSHLKLCGTKANTEKFHLIPRHASFLLSVCVSFSPKWVCILYIFFFCAATGFFRIELQSKN